MAKILKYEDEEEFYAEFIRVDGKRGAVLIFASDDERLDMALAEDIAKTLDADNLGRGRMAGREPVNPNPSKKEDV